MMFLVIFMICLLAVILLYLVMIMPGLRREPSAASFRKWLYAHRGLHDNASNAPENSLRAFQKAVDAGFGIEMDVQLSKDQVPVVFHDNTLKRVCGAEGKVKDFTYDELQRFRLCGTDQRIPKFEEVLKLVDGRVPLIVELKIDTADLALCPIADGLLSTYRGMYCVESFNPLAVRWYRKNRREIIRGQLSDAFIKEGEYVGPLYFMMQNLLFNWLARPDFIAYNRKYPKILSRLLCRKLFGNTAAAWTVKSLEQLEEARKYFDIYIFDSFLPDKT